VGASLVDDNALKFAEGIPGSTSPEHKQTGIDTPFRKYYKGKIVQLIMHPPGLIGLGIQSESVGGDDINILSGGFNN
jgi:hypothetical protein